MTALEAARDRLEATVREWIASPTVTTTISAQRMIILRRLEDEISMAVRRETTVF